MFKRTSSSQEPTLEQVYSSASGQSAYAKSTFATVVDELTEANRDFAKVEEEVGREIERLTAVRNDAVLQRETNEAVIQRVNDLIGV